METFNYPYHTIETENPESGTRLQLGNSYVFSAPSSDPDQRVFKLGLTGMQYFWDSEDDLDASVTPTRNMLNLINFYNSHKLNKSFLYNHAVHGEVEVKFSKPLKEPKVIKGSRGVVEDFEIELLEIP